MNKTSNRIIIILFFLLGIIGFAIQVQAANCGDTNSDGVTDTVCACGDTVVGAVGYTYQLAGNLGSCSGDGLIVGADEITIDGGNYTITGDGGVGDYGIDNSDGYDTIIIQNFTNITNFDHGVYLGFSTTTSTIQNVTANSNSKCGIYLVDESTYNNIINNTCSNNAQWGIHVGTMNSVNNQVIGNTCRNNEAGIFVDESINTTLTNNTCSGNTDAGIWLEFLAHYTTVTNNNCSNNPGDGIYIQVGDYNNLTNNTCSDNGSNGIFMQSLCENNTLTNNTCSNNSDNGIHIMDGSSNELTGNTLNNNSNYGIYLSTDGEYIPENNTITLNYLFNNVTNNAASDSGGANNWDSAGRGNWWDDWQPPNHPDSDNNGIVDDPRPITGGANQDNFPLVDVTGPTCSISSISVSNNYGYVSGSTIYYHPFLTGSFTVNVSASDEESGVWKVNFPDTVSAGGDDTDSPYSFDYNWDTSDTFSRSADVTCYDNMNNTQTASFTVIRDITAFQTDNSGGVGGPNCFIATACYGTPMAEEVKVLSQFRDEYLLTNPIGEGFVRTYNKVSPRVALFITEHPVLKRVVRGALNPLIRMSRKID